MFDFGGGSRTDNKTANFVREGVVSQVFPERHSCRVTFPDRGNLVSAELPILTPFASKNKCYKLPDVDETVIVLTASNDITSGGGYVIGSIFDTSNNPPPENNQEVTKIVFADNTFISYDREKHLFTFQFSDESSITFDGENSELTINCKGNITVNSEKQIEVTAQEEINVTAEKDINMQGENIRLN